MAYILNYFEKVYNGTLGLPYLPAKWVGKEKYTKILKVRMTCGGGMGGASWYEYIKEIPMEELINNDKLVVKTFDGEEKLINTRYLVKAERFTIVTRKFYNENSNFDIGEYTANWLIPYGTKVTFKDTITHY